MPRLEVRGPAGASSRASEELANAGAVGARRAGSTAPRSEIFAARWLTRRADLLRHVATVVAALAGLGVRP